MQVVAQQYGPVILVAFGLVISQILIKRGLGAGGPIVLASPADLVVLIKRVLTTPMLLTGYGVSGITAVTWLVAISRLDLSVALPTMNAIFYVLLLLASIVVLHESVGPRQWIGVTFVLAGIALISRAA
jgi:drug/metabolite transporter (DMT)-like permease